MSTPVELHFVDWSRPALHPAAALLADAYAGDEAVDLSSVAIALPGARAGRRLLELLLEEAERRGRPLRPPLVVTAGSLPELLAPPTRPEPAPLLERRLWAEELRRRPGDEVEVLVNPPPGRQDLAAWMELAGTLVSLESTVGAGLHDFDGVARACGEGGLFDDGERWRLLARVQKGVRRRMRDLGLLSRSDHRRAVVRERRKGGSGSQPTPGAWEGDLWLVGVAELPPVIRSVLAVAPPSGRLHAVVHAPASRAPLFDELGCVRPEAWRSLPVAVPDGAIRVVGGPRDQADVLVRELRRVGSAGSPPSAEEVTVGVPDPEVIPYVEDRLQVEGAPARRAGGRPVSETAPFRLLVAVTEHLRERSWESLAALLRHPDLDAVFRGSRPAAGPDGAPADSSPEEGGGRDRDLPPVMTADRYHAHHLPARPAEGAFPHMRATRELIPGLERVRARTGELLGALQGSRRLSRWGEPVRRLLEKVYGEGELDPRRPTDRAVLEVARGVSEALDGLAALPPGLDDEVDGATVLRLILDELRGGSVPEPPEDEAVELLGWLELHLDDAPVMVVTGVNEPHLPESVTGDPFLPHALRRRLGLLDNDTRWARDLYRLRAILESRRETVLVAGRRDAAGDPLRPSRLLLAEEGRTMARRLGTFLREQPGENGVESALEGATQPGEDPFALPPEPEIRDPKPRDELSVTAFTALLRDPYRYALERVLKLNAVDDRAREMDALAFGDLVHRVLQRFGRGEGRNATDEAEIRAMLDALLEREAASRFGTLALPAVRIQVGQLRARLHAFARWQAQWAGRGWRIVGAEVQPEGGRLRWDVDDRPFYLRGRIDRVDHHRDSGRWILFDYKSSARARAPDETHRKKTGRAADAPKEWVDLQLPLYRHLIRGVLTADGTPLVPAEEVRRVELGYINLPHDLDAVGEAVAEEWSEMELLEADERARQVVRFVRANRFVWDPEANTIRSDDPLAPLVGIGAYRDLDDDDGEDADG